MITVCRYIEVAQVIALSPHMRRIIFKGDDLNSFPVGKESAHVKVLIPKQGESAAKFSFSLTTKKRLRSYTVRYFDSKNKQLTIDFVVNKHIGSVSNWAAHANLGDKIGIIGPGKAKFKNIRADWNLFFGEFCALPAMTALLEKLPFDAKGHALLQVPSREDIPVLKIPNSINITWIINACDSKNKILEQLQLINWLPGAPLIFAAGESSHIQEWRQFLNQQDEFDYAKATFSAYWKA
jgi:NADPH-dependent ferric siderophore reductase